MIIEMNFAQKMKVILINFVKAVSGKDDLPHPLLSQLLVEKIIKLACNNTQKFQWFETQDPERNTLAFPPPQFSWERKSFRLAMI